MAINFYIPPTLKEDFNAFLATNVTNQVVETEIIHNWYDKAALDYEPYIQKCEFYPDSTKSRYENTDSIVNVRFSLDTEVWKGDIIIHPNGDLFVLDWDVPPELNNKASRGLRCNFYLHIERWKEDEVDPETGMLVPGGEGHFEVLVPDIPCNAYHYDGRPEYSNHMGAPGVVPNDLTILVVQYNDYTKNIRVDDEFQWGQDRLKIINVSFVAMDLIHGDNKGILKIQAKKIAGGTEYE